MSYDQAPDQLLVSINPWVRVQCCAGRAMPYLYLYPCIPVNRNTWCYLYPCHALGICNTILITEDHGSVPLARGFVRRLPFCQAGDMVLDVLVQALMKLEDDM
jgi:hypothetical protein